MRLSKSLLSSVLWDLVCGGRGWFVAGCVCSVFRRVVGVCVSVWAFSSVVPAGRPRGRSVQLHVIGGRGAMVTSKKLRCSLLVATIAGVWSDVHEGLYSSAGSAVTSLTKMDEVPPVPGPEQPYMLLELYSSWCGHCQHFAPIYESVAMDARVKAPKLLVAAVNCVAHEDICNAHKVNSYPTLLIYPGGQRFSGNINSKESVLAWAMSHAPAKAAAGGGGSGAVHHGSDVGGGIEQQHQQQQHQPPPPPPVEEMLEHLLSTTSGAAAAIAASAHAGHAAAHAATYAATAAIAHEKAEGAHPHLAPRQMPQPVPVIDVLAAARYSLYHEVAAALSAAPSQAYARKRLGALRGWLHVLHRALPHERDVRATPQPEDRRPQTPTLTLPRRRCCCCRHCCHCCCRCRAQPPRRVLS